MDPNPNSITPARAFKEFPACVAARLFRLVEQYMYYVLGLVCSAETAIPVQGTGPGLDSSNNHPEQSMRREIQHLYTKSRCSIRIHISGGFWLVIYLVICPRISPFKDQAISTHPNKNSSPFISSCFICCINRILLFEPINTGFVFINFPMVTSPSTCSICKAGWQKSVLVVNYTTKKNYS